jgi:flagellar motor component MotA
MDTTWVARVLTELNAKARREGLRALEQDAAAAAVLAAGLEAVVEGAPPGGVEAAMEARLAAVAAPARAALRPLVAAVRALQEGEPDDAVRARLGA